MGATGNSPKKSNVPPQENQEEINSDDNDQMAEEENEIVDQANDYDADVKEVLSENVKKSESLVNPLSFLKKARGLKNKKLPIFSTGKISHEAAAFSEDHLQKFFLESFGESSSKVFDIVSVHGQLQIYGAGDSIVVKGEKVKGIFVILKGQIGVVTADSTVTIDIIETGEVFGEMSSMYDIPSTANVVALSNAEIVLVPKDQFRKLLEDFDTNMDIIDWCIHRRYLPTSDFIDSERAYRRIAFTFFRKLNFFLAWPDNALKNLILSIEHGLVILYPVRSMLIIEGDPLNGLVCVIKGTVEICRGPRVIAEIVVDRKRKPFVFGTSGIFSDNQISSVSLRAKDTCQVIVVLREAVVNVTKEFPALQNDLLDKRRVHLQFLDRLGHIYKKYQPDLEVEVLVYMTQRSDYYSVKPEVDIQNKVRQGVYREFDAGSTVFLTVEQESIEAFLVIRGEVELSRAGEIGTDESEIQKQVASEGTVVLLEYVRLNSVRATCPSVILKLPKLIRRPSQEQANLGLV